MANLFPVRVLPTLGWICHGAGVALIFLQRGFSTELVLALSVVIGPLAAILPRGAIHSRLIGVYCGLVAILAAYPFIWGVSLSSLGAVLSILGTFALLMGSAIKPRAT